MRRAAVLALILIALPLAAAEKWWDFYKRGVAAVQSGSYQAGIDALQRSLAESPNEAASVRPRNETFTYVPHYWIGVAKLQLGDADGAMREWRTSEEQGAIQKTPLYADMRTWAGKAQSLKQHASDSASADQKREANAAVGRAVSAQMDALAAGADRSDAYRAAQRKLKEAMESTNSRRAVDVAQQARDLFAAAAEEAKKQKVARRPAPAVRETPQPLPAQVQPKIEITAAAPPPPPPVAKPTQATTPTHDNRLGDQLQAAYRAFAAGDLTTADQLLSSIVNASSTGEAYLLRGCVRYTRSALTRQPDMRAAVADFRAALKANRALRLDRRAFSPKLVAFFEGLKSKT